MQTGPTTDTSTDDRSDVVECKVCHKTFKKRGINIHLARSKCGTVNQTSSPQRTKSKSLNKPTPEPNHRRGNVQGGRRTPFIVSQIFHRTPQQNVPLESEQHEENVVTSWSDFLAEETPPGEPESVEEAVSETPRRKGWIQKPMTEWFSGKSKQSKVESPQQGSTSKKDTNHIEKAGTHKEEKKKSFKDPKLTRYFGIKVKGQNSLNEWLTAMGKISPKKKETSTEDTQDNQQQEPVQSPKAGSENSWEITDVWQPVEGDILKLTDRELDDLRKVVRQGEERELLADHHLFIYRADLQSLYDRNYLNDTIIDEYLLMIKARNPEDIAVLNTFFYQRLDTLGFEKGYEETRSWIKEDLRSKESIFIPICKNDHWRLVHIDTRKKLVSYLDSIVGARKASNAPGLMKMFIEKYFEEKGDPQRFKIKIRDNIPVQQNGVDCGVFLCAYAERISRQAGFNFNQSNMSLFRWKMTWEILNGTLKEFAQVSNQQEKKTVKTASEKTKSKATRKKVTVEAESEGRKKNIQWPAANSEEWGKLDMDLTMMLRTVGNTAEAKAELHPQIIYKVCLDRFGEVDTKKKQMSKPSRRQTKGQKLREQIKSLKNAWKEASEEEKDGISELQSRSIRELRLLKRAESIRKRRKKHKENTDSFYKQPYTFARKVLDPEVKGDLENSKEEVEEYLRKTHSDKRRDEDLGDVQGLYEYPQPEHEYDTSPPTLREFQAVLKKARTKSAAGPNGVPYRLYKRCPGVAKLLWNYIKGLWRKNKMADSWRRADGVLIPKEDKASQIEKFRTISLLNTEGKIFWKLKSDKLTTFFMRNHYIDASIQKGGIPGISGCLEHTSILSHLIMEARKGKLDLVSTWLDIANAYGSIAHMILGVALERAHAPKEVQDLVRSYYAEVDIRFTTKNFTTEWQRVEKGIITGCTLSVILFALTMTMLLSSTKRETRGPVTTSGQQQENARLYMDDVNTTTRSITQTHHLLDEIERFFTWARLSVKPEKCRALVIEKGTLKNKPVLWQGAEITSIMKKPIKYLGKEYNYSLTDQQQMDETLERLKRGVKRIDRTFIAGKNKCWIVQNMLIPRLMWPLTIYNFPQTKVEIIQRKITAHLKKWLGIPKSLSPEMLYARSAVIQLPYTSIVEEVKVARTRTQVMLQSSSDDCISKANISLDAGRKWRVTEAIEESKSKLRLQEIAGIANKGREGLGMNHRQYYSKSSKREKSKLIVQKVREAEEERRLVKAGGLASQGRSLRWEVQQRVMKDKEMRQTSEALFQFSIKAVYDLLPTPQNKNRWFRTDQYKCNLCSKTGTLDHILTGCEVALGQGRYKWRHDRVLRELGHWIDEKRKTVNSMPWKKRPVIKFKKAGEKVSKSAPVMQESIMKIARDWKIQVDFPENPLVIPAHIAATTQRPDIILTSEAVKQMVIIELTVPTEERIGVTTELKTARYEDKVAKAAELKGWRTIIYAVEVGCRGFPAPSMGRMLKEIGYEGRQKREILKKLSSLAEESSLYIWKTSHMKTWGDRA